MTGPGGWKYQGSEAHIQVGQASSPYFRSSGSFGERPPTPYREFHSGMQEVLQEVLPCYQGGK